MHALTQCHTHMYNMHTHIHRTTQALTLYTYMHNAFIHTCSPLENTNYVYTVLQEKVSVISVPVIYIGYTYILHPITHIASQHIELATGNSFMCP